MKLTETLRLCIATDEVTTFSGLLRYPLQKVSQRAQNHLVGLFLQAAHDIVKGIRGREEFLYPVVAVHLCFHHFHDLRAMPTRAIKKNLLWYGYDAPGHPRVRMHLIECVCDLTSNTYSPSMILQNVPILSNRGVQVSTKSFEGQQSVHWPPCSQPQQGTASWIGQPWCHRSRL